jgi:hypothetical protein
MAKVARTKSRARAASKSRNALATKTKAGATKVSGAKKRAPTRAGGSKTRRSEATKVMGVTIPKGLTEALDSLVNSPRGREILASALVAAASAAAAALVKSPDSPQRAKARLAAADVSEQVADATKDLSEAAAGALADMVTGAARSLLPTSLTGKIKREGS